MKAKILFLAIIGLFLVTSCKKEVVYPTSQLPPSPKLSDIGGIGRWGKFLIIGSRKMVTNTETGVKTYYDDFGLGSRSSLRWGGSLFDIEDIIKDTTTYSFWEPKGFPGDGKFVLNEDTTKYYKVHYTKHYMSIIEDPDHGQQNMGGSARPISYEAIDITNKIILLYIETSYVQINGSLCEYFTELKLKKTQEW